MAHEREHDENNPDQVEATAKDIARVMRDLDITMMATITDNGRIASRPMSNNRDVEFDGTSYYFTLDDKRIARDIAANPNVTLSFSGEGQWLTMLGTGKLIKDRQAFEKHYTPDLDAWFDGGIDCPGLVLVEVTAQHASAWCRVSGEVDYQ